MRVIWSPRALDAREQIAGYIGRRFGKKHRTEFLQEVRKTTRALKSNPNIGAIDPLFADRPTAYRSIIINGLSKMVYYIDDEFVRIAAFWDTRREPQSQAKLTE